MNKNRIDELKNQLTDYEYIISDQNSKLRILTHENTDLKKTIELLQTKLKRLEDENKKHLLSKNQKAINDGFTTPVKNERIEKTLQDQKSDASLQIKVNNNAQFKSDLSIKTPMLINSAKHERQKLIPLKIASNISSSSNKDADKESKSNEIPIRNFRFYNKFSTCKTITDQTGFFGNNFDSEKFEKAFPTLMRAFSMSEKKKPVGDKKMSEYEEFIDQIKNKNNAQKIEVLISLCHLREKMDVTRNFKKALNRKSTYEEFGSKQHQIESLKMLDDNRQTEPRETSCEIEKYLKNAHVEEHDNSAQSQQIVLEEDIKNLGSLFNNFIIIAPEKSSIDDFSIDYELNVENLYIQRSPKNKDLAHQLEQISKFVVPFGERLKLVKTRNNNGKIKDLISRTCEKFEFFSFSLNSEISDKTNYLFDQSEQKKTGKLDILSAVNSNCFVYFYCLKFEDFFINIDDKKQIGTDLYQIFFYPKVFVIKTFYPFSQLFEQLLTNIFFQIQVLKIKSIDDAQLDGKIDLNQLEKFDGASNLSVEIAYFTSTLNRMSQFSVSNDFGKKITIDLPNGAQLNYQYPSIKNAFLVDSETYYNHVFSIFCFEDFLFVLFALIHEHSIIFVSEKLSTISSCINTFLTLIKPFQWQFPRIYSLPEDCLLMLNSPIPIISGLNLSCENVLSDIIPEFESTKNGGSSSNLYVFLDQGIYHYDFKNYENMSLPDFNGLIEKLEKIYRTDFNSKTSDWFKLNKVKKEKGNFLTFQQTNIQKMKMKIEKMENVIIDKRQGTPNSKQQADLKESDSRIFHTFQELFAQNIIKKFNPIKEKCKEMFEFKKEVISSFENSADFEFMQDFSKTQAFSYFIEKYFEENTISMN